MTAMHTDLIDVSGSCAHAKDAFPAWAKTPPAERGSVLLAAAEVLAEHAEELAELNQRETGKLRADSVGGVEAGIGTLRQYAELGPLHQGERLQGAIEAIDYSLPEPRGLVAVITPWNDPVAIACGLIGAALVTGNVVVHKPSERCPQLGERLGELLEPAFPTGVFTTLSGPGETGADLVANPEVDMIAHVGSTATGRRIARAAALTGAHVILENGGNDALIVDAGVDPVWAAQQAALGCFANGGQICTSVERIFVHEQVAETFTEAPLAEAKQWMQTDRLASTAPPRRGVPVDANRPARPARRRTHAHRGARASDRIRPPRRADPPRRHHPGRAGHRVSGHGRHRLHALDAPVHRRNFRPRRGDRALRFLRGSAAGGSGRRSRARGDRAHRVDRPRQPGRRPLARGDGQDQRGLRRRPRRLRRAPRTERNRVRLRPAPPR